MFNKFFFLFLLFGLSQGAYAACSGSTGAMKINIGTITVGANSLNTTGTSYLLRAGNSYSDILSQLYLNCDNPFTVIGHVTNPVPGTSNLEKVMLDTGEWSGLGFRFNLVERNNIYHISGLAPPDSATVNSDTFCFRRTCTGEDTEINLLGLVDVYGGNSSVVPGNINQTITGAFTADGYDAIDYHITGNVVAASCSVNSATKDTVDLGTTYSSDLLNIGATSNPTQFSILLDCNANVNVNLTMSGTEDSDAMGQGVLALGTPQSGTSADGVGVQLLFNNTPIQLNQAFDAGTAGSGSFEIPMVAQYYKTKDKLKTGEVNAIATYTLNYL